MIIGLWGDDKTCKTTFGLTAPKPLVVMEFDIGGFERASHRFKAEIDAGQIKVVPFPFPIKGVSIDSSGKMIMLDPRRINGMLELKRQFDQAFVAAILDKSVASIMIDTGTLLWEMMHSSVLQVKQDAQFNPDGSLKKDMKGNTVQLREKLLPIEYSEANSAMRGMLYNGKNFGKNIIILHHARDEFVDKVDKDGSIKEIKSGKRERAGWSGLGASADIIVHSSVEYGLDNNGNKQITPWIEIELCGLALNAVGQKIPIPTWDKMMNLIQMVK